MPRSVAVFTSTDALPAARPGGICRPSDLKKLEASRCAQFARPVRGRFSDVALHGEIGAAVDQHPDHRWILMAGRHRKHQRRHVAASPSR